MRQVTQTRPVTYETQIINEKGRQIGNVNSTGYEVSREVDVCANCASKEANGAASQAEGKVVKSTTVKQKRKKSKDKDKDKD